MKRVRVESSNRSTTKEGEADGVQDGDTESGKTHKMKVVRQKFAVGMCALLCFSTHTLYILYTLKSLISTVQKVDWTRTWQIGREELMHHI